MNARSLVRRMSVGTVAAVTVFAGGAGVLIAEAAPASATTSVVSSLPISQLLAEIQSAIGSLVNAEGLVSQIEGVLGETAIIVTTPTGTIFVSLAQLDSVINSVLASLGGIGSLGGLGGLGSVSSILTGVLDQLDGLLAEVTALLPSLPGAPGLGSVTGLVTNLVSELESAISSLTASLGASASGSGSGSGGGGLTL